MIIKGDARSGSAAAVAYLAWHLQRLDNNEEYTIREISGTLATDLLGALKELSAFGAGTRTKRPLYVGIITFDPKEPRPEEWQKVFAVERLSHELGLADQPRVVVEHVKDGWLHLHVVWSRVDVERGTAIHDGLNYRRHERAARELEIVFGHQQVQGPLVGRLGTPRPNRAPSNAEMRQAERTGVGPAEMTGMMTVLWQRTDTGRSFVSALKAEGCLLARGDRCDFVILDPRGEVHSLRRRVEGARAADIRARMADVDPDTLPTVSAAKAAQRACWAELLMDEEVRGIPVWATRELMDCPPWLYKPDKRSPRPVSIVVPAFALGKPFGRAAPTDSQVARPNSGAPPPTAPAASTPAQTPRISIKLGVGPAPTISRSAGSGGRRQTPPGSAQPVPLPPGKSIQLGVGPAPTKSRNAGSRGRGRTPPGNDQPAALPPGKSIPMRSGPEPPTNDPKPPFRPPPGWSMRLGVGPSPPSGSPRGRGRGRGRGPGNTGH